jgi:hypothetical protein
MTIGKWPLINSHFSLGMKNMLIKICRGSPLWPPNWEPLPTAGRRRVTPLQSCWIILALIIAIILLWAFWPICYLEVRSLGRPKASFSLSVSPGDRFSIWFFHSYDRAFFQENYEIDFHQQILLRDMAFKSHLNGGGFAYPHFHLRSDGVGELKEINEKRHRVEFMMGSKDLANHTLLWKERRIELSDHFEAGEIVSIRVAKKTGWKRLLQFINKNGERRP